VVLTELLLNFLAFWNVPLCSLQYIQATQLTFLKTKILILVIFGKQCKTWSSLHKYFQPSC